MKSRRSRFPPLVKIAVAAAAAFLVGELAVRALVPLDALVYEDSENPVLAVQLRPGASGLKNGVDVAVSAQGLRDELVPSPKPPDERRVVVVGGYETFGVGVPLEQVYVRELADGLLGPGQGRVRTINLSMYSYHLKQKVELACSRLSSLEPDVAVLQVTVGDGSGVYGPLLRLPSFKNWVRSHSALLRWASERYYLRKRAPGAGSEDYEETRRQIRRFSDCAAAAGAKAAVLYLPDLTKEPVAASEFRRGVDDAVKEKALPFLDGSPALAAVPEGSRELFAGEKFPSPAAHRALADAVRKWLKPLLERRRAPARRPSA